MKIIPLNQIEALPQRPVISVGMFDGVHKGHQRLIGMVVESAKRMRTLAAVITFSNHPQLVLKTPDAHSVKLLQTNEERMRRLEMCGLDLVITIDFSEDFSRLSATAFLDLLIAKLHPALMIMGYNNYFGRNTAGELDKILSKGCFGDMKIHRTDTCVYSNGTEVSSTQIRRALARGDVSSANAMLGYRYSLSGIVVHGLGKGHQLNFPTANLKLNPLKLIPASGVYAVIVRLSSLVLKGVMFVGERATFGLSGLTIEVHILDFDNDIYLQEIEVAMVAFIRPQRRFEDSERLINQIKLDCDEVKRLSY
ncbi:MAG: riboflavin biosynthesis protein RibF [Bacteroidales bacterium]|nr:riboflavin biosynthesis protein RibF [Bacteroidales bacterium]